MDTSHTVVLPKIGWEQVLGGITPAGSAEVALLDTGVDASHPELAGKVPRHLDARGRTPGMDSSLGV